MTSISVRVVTLNNVENFKGVNTSALKVLHFSVYVIDFIHIRTL